MLIATQNILYQNRQYEAGDALPNYDPNLTKAWLDSGSAIDKSEVVETEVPTTFAIAETSETETKPKARKKK